MRQHEEWEEEEEAGKDIGNVNVNKKIAGVNNDYAIDALLFLDERDVEIYSIEKSFSIYWKTAINILSLI